jgi:hypothetical protein
MFSHQKAEEYRIMAGRDKRINRDPLAMRMREELIKESKRVCLANFCIPCKTRNTMPSLAKTMKMLTETSPARTKFLCPLFLPVYLKVCWYLSSLLFICTLYRREGKRAVSYLKLEEEYTIISICNRANWDVMFLVYEIFWFKYWSPNQFLWSPPAIIANLLLYSSYLC